MLVRGKWSEQIFSPCRQLNSNRESITDAAAVYFVLPTRDNVNRICEDCRAQLYDAHYFNFVTPISRELLEQLAKVAVETNCVPQIRKVPPIRIVFEITIILLSSFFFALSVDKPQ